MTPQQQHVSVRMDMSLDTMRLVAQILGEATTRSGVPHDSLAPVIGQLERAIHHRKLAIRRTRQRQADQEASRRRALRSGVTSVTPRDT